MSFNSCNYYVPKPLYHWRMLPLSWLLYLCILPQRDFKNAVLRTLITFGHNCYCYDCLYVSCIRIHCFGQIVLGMLHEIINVFLLCRKSIIDESAIATYLIPRLPVVWSGNETGAWNCPSHLASFPGSHTPEREHWSCAGDKYLRSRRAWERG